MARSKQAEKDAIALLKADHRQVEDWFEQFEKARDSERKQELATKICNALKVHTTIEEEIFYPAFLEASDDVDIHHEAEIEHQLFQEYRDVSPTFRFVVETERRFYLANSVDVKVRTDGGEVFFDVTMADAWVWDIYRPARFVKNVRVVTFKDVNVEELPKPDIKLPESGDFS